MVGQCLLAIALAGEHLVGGQKKPGNAPTDWGNLTNTELNGLFYLPRKKNDPRPDTKLLLSALIKAKPAQNFKLNILYENMI